MQDSHSASQQPLQLGQHVVSITEDAGSQLDLLASAFRAALSQGCQCMYVGDQVAAGTLASHLAARGCDLGQASEAGQFQGFTPGEVYTAGGRFDVERVIDGLHNAIESARANGFTGLCAAGDSAWVWQGIPGIDRLLEYEYRVNVVENRESAVLMCLYDRGRTSPWFESELLKCHPMVHNEGGVTHSAQFIPGPVELADVPLLEDLEPPADSLPCEMLCELLSAYADGELLERRREEVARHLATCRHCASTVEDYRKLKLAAAARVRPPVPGGLWDRVISQLSEDVGDN